MIKSMTGYGRYSKDTPIGKLVIEIQSLNRKMLDMHLVVPKELFRFEIEIRKWIGEVVYRGQLQVRIHLKQEDGLVSRIPRLREMKSSWESVAAGLGFAPQEVVTFPFLVEQMQMPHMPQETEDEAAEKLMKEALKEGIYEALKQLMSMKEREGAALAADIEARLKILETELEKAEDRSLFAVDKYREKLQERMKECQMAGVEVDERILREIVIYAERLDVSEEKTRLRSHIEQFRHLLQTTEPSIGKTMDFLTQELNREVNTLASKSADIELSLLTVAMKSEIEKMREQVQNIE